MGKKKIRVALALLSTSLSSQIHIALVMLGIFVTILSRFLAVLNGRISLLQASLLQLKAKSTSVS